MCLCMCVCMCVWCVYLCVHVCVVFVCGVCVCMRVWCGVCVASALTKNSFLEVIGSKVASSQTA